jgi:hypothetical protein
MKPTKTALSKKKKPKKQGLPGSRNGTFARYAASCDPREAKVIQQGGL